MDAMPAELNPDLNDASVRLLASPSALPSAARNYKTPMSVVHQYSPRFLVRVFVRLCISGTCSPAHLSLDSKVASQGAWHGAVDVWGTGTERSMFCWEGSGQRNWEEVYLLDGEKEDYSKKNGAFTPQPFLVPVLA
ncbi:hypothetical protein NDU88_000281 [Pleurodeles waltl]|uniref:Uncharacterized protein n=1 Tax=Pleurodeles waltl TaxID=8319 RepID=A0AAV7TFD1_PLEWA|nr:hypothetical protein NDU88_000281 [Pleurodeles waltl]